MEKSQYPLRSTSVFATSRADDLGHDLPIRVRAIVIGLFASVFSCVLVSGVEALVTVRAPGQQCAY